MCLIKLRALLRAPLAFLGLLLLLVLGGDPRGGEGIQASGDPDLGRLDRRHLALVINSADPLSEAIGSHYQRTRRIPDDQVIRVALPPLAALTPAQFNDIRQAVIRRTPAHVQIYALAWREPYRVGCLSITTAFAFGYDPRHCAEGCRPTRISPLFARGEVRRPWSELGIRPTMLLAAANLRQGLALINRGVIADGSEPTGTAYLLSTSDGARNVRARGYALARAVLGPGFQVVLLNSDALRNASDVMFYFTGLIAVPAIETNRYRPGAVADHLTSFGGQLRSADDPDPGGQMSALRWLEAGATGSYGTVVEPCNISAKFPDPALLMLFYRRGDTLIEAYWRSVAMPGQGVFIGEPLARPWRR